MLLSAYAVYDRSDFIKQLRNVMMKELIFVNYMKVFIGLKITSIP